MSVLATVAAAALAGYLCGSIPSGVLVGRFVTGRDVRESGSGKSGFTNTLRSAGVVAALVVLAADTAKGARRLRRSVGRRGGGPARRGRT